MPFDPRLIHPDDAPLRPDGDLDLPADLAALAEQLADDAFHLSARYPAAREPQVALAAELVESAERIKTTGQPARGTWRRAAVLVGAGLASVAVIGLSLLSLSARRDDGDRASEFVSTPALPADRAAPAVVAPTPVTFAAPATSSLSLGELSAPEMEALFDLLQREPNRASTISF